MWQGVARQGLENRGISIELIIVIKTTTRIITTQKSNLRKYQLKNMSTQLKKEKEIRLLNDRFKKIK